MEPEAMALALLVQRKNILIGRLDALTNIIFISILIGFEMFLDLF